MYLVSRRLLGGCFLREGAFPSSLLLPKLSNSSESVSLTAIGLGLVIEAGPSSFKRRDGRRLVMRFRFPIIVMVVPAVF